MTVGNGAIAPQAVLRFWFEDATPEQWFQKDDAFDAAIAARFAETNRLACAGALDVWAEDPRGRLALIVAIDQFSRNLHRGSPRAFAADGKALGLTREGIARGHDAPLAPVEKPFFYMPLMHSEHLGDQELCVDYFRALAKVGGERAAKGLEAAIRHHEIIERFGRFPHRNEVLGRKTTPEEAAFLKEPNSSF